jgi:dihydrolipoamide dehydrogenase
VRFPEPEVDLERLRDWKQEVVRKLTSGLGKLRRGRKISYLRGRGRFTAAGEVEVETHDGDRSRVSFAHALAATGSSAAPLLGAPSGSSRILDSTGALSLPAVPGRLLVVGGGYIGAELGTVYAALGSRVTLVEAMSSLLPGVDSDLVRPLAGALERRFEEILLERKVTAWKERADGVEVQLEGDGQVRLFDAALVAVGRKPNSRDLGLSQAGVEVDRQGFVQVDAQMRTSASRVFAIGDLVGPPMLAHKASSQGKAAVEALLGKATRFEPYAIPAVVFTDPEIAWCGITEAQARRDGREVQVRRFPWTASGRAMTLDRTEGCTKLLFDPATGRLLGAGLVGAGAGELISEMVLGLEMGARAEDLSWTIHPHPTLSETLMEAAESFFGRSTHLARTRS